MLSHCGLHDMNDDRARIDEYPLSRLFAFDAIDLYALRLQLFLNVSR